jgi:hypothetical protein
LKIINNLIFSIFNHTKTIMIPIAKDVLAAQLNLTKKETCYKNIQIRMALSSNSVPVPSNCSTVLYWAVCPAYSLKTGYSSAGS